MPRASAGWERGWPWGVKKPLARSEQQSIGDKVRDENDNGREVVYDDLPDEDIIARPAAHPPQASPRSTSKPPPTRRHVGGHKEAVQGRDLYLHGQDQRGWAGGGQGVADSLPSIRVLAQHRAADGAPHFDGLSVRCRPGFRVRTRASQQQHVDEKVDHRRLIPRFPKDVLGFVGVDLGGDQLRGLLAARLGGSGNVDAEAGPTAVKMKRIIREGDEPLVLHLPRDDAVADEVHLALGEGVLERELDPLGGEGKAFPVGLKDRRH